MQTIYLDISKKSIIPPINAKQNDSGRKFKVFLFDGGIPYNADEAVNFSLWYAGESGDGNYDTVAEESAFYVEGNSVVVELSPQMLKNPGSGQMCLTMSDADNRTIGLWNITYEVEAMPGYPSDQKKPYYPRIVRTVNGVAPDENGNVEIEGGSVGGSITAESITEALGYTPFNGDDAFTTRQSETPDYTNLFPLYGYESGQVLSADGGLSDTTADRYVSGFIPVTKGDVVRIKDPSGVLINNNTRIALYTSGMDSATGIGKTPTDISSNAAYGTVTVDDDTITWDTSSITYYNWNNFAYLRVTVGSANAVVTVNEELTQSVKEQYILRPEVKVQKDSLDFEVSDKPLSGKTVVCFGDSLFGMHRDSTSAPANIALKTGATVHNVGFGGCRMSVHPTAGYAAFSMWALAKAIAENTWAAQDGEAPNGSSYFREQLDLLQSIDFDEVDMVVIHYGTNDFTAGGGVAMDNADDPDDCNTLCGALRYSVEKLLGAYPKLQIFVSLPVFRYWTADDGTITYSDDYINSSGQTLPEFVEALRGVAEEYHLPVIDGYHGMGINEFNAYAFLSDGTHHNEDGRKLFGEFIGGQLISATNAAGNKIPKTLIVTFTDNGDGTLTASHSPGEIRDVVESGGWAYAKFDSILLQLGVEEGTTFFVTLPDSNKIESIIIVINDDKTAVVENLQTNSLPNPEALTINGTSYYGQEAVDMTEAVNALIDAKLGVIENGTY